MQIAKTYYLVDIVAEKIVGSFNAISDESARRTLNNVISDKRFEGYSDCINVYKDMSSDVRILETFEETQNCVFFDFLIRPFEGVHEVHSEDSEDA